MSENPYAPPRAVLATPQVLADGTGTIDLGRCAQEAWHDTWANFPLWLGAGIVWLLATVAGVATLLGVVLLVPVIYWGGYAFFLKMHDGGARIGDVFSGFSRYAQALLGMLGYFIVSVLIGAPAQIAVQYGSRSPEHLWIVGIGYLLVLGVTLFITPRLNFAPFLMVDRHLGLGDALGQSWSRTAGVIGRLALLTLPFALLMLLTGLAVMVGAATLVGATSSIRVAIVSGALAFLVGVIPASVFIFLLWVSAYRQIFGGARAS
jgi:hypothetical protein